eukprot:1508133-Rhodomonas_salina.2
MLREIQDIFSARQDAAAHNAPPALPSVSSQSPCARCRDCGCNWIASGMAVETESDRYLIQRQCSEVLAGCPQLVDMASHPSENDDDDVDDEDGDEEDAGKDSKQASANGNSGGKERKGKGKLMSKEGMEREAVSAD